MIVNKLMTINSHKNTSVLDTNTSDLSPGLPLVAPLASILDCYFAGRVLAVHAYQRICTDLVIAAFDVKHRRHLAGNPVAHEPMLRLVLLEQLRVGVQSAAHSTAITRKGLIVGNYLISPFAQNGYGIETGFNCSLSLLAMPLYHPTIQVHE